SLNVKEKKITRRTLFASFAALAAASGVSVPSMASERDSSNPARIQFGAQTNAWPINPGDFSTLLGALTQIRGVGYSGFETGFLNLRTQFKAPEQARRRIAATGLRFFGVHIFLQEYDYLTGIAPRETYEPV